eukprot:30835-Pelagococcus_subviridis.AAC.6
MHFLRSQIRSTVSYCAAAVIPAANARFRSIVTVTESLKGKRQNPAVSKVSFEPKPSVEKSAVTARRRESPIWRYFSEST